MAGIDSIVQLTISRETTTVSKPGFGVPALIAKFAADDPTTPFTSRYRTYGSLTEVADDWATSSEIYQAANQLFAQNPSVDTLFVGRWDAGDADLATALNAIQLDSADWYTFNVIGQKDAKLVFDADFVASNSIVATVNGTAVTAVAFDTDQATTMAALETQIETDISGATVTVSDTRELTIVIADTDVFVSAVVTGGTTQPNANGYSTADTVATDAASWAEANRKIFFHTSSDPEIHDGAVTDDLFSTLQGLSYDRTVSSWKALGEQYFETAWPGECLPFDPGSQTWSYKTIAGVSPDKLTDGQFKAVLDKNGNIYNTVSSVNITRYGKTASGQYIDTIRGQDWLEAEIQAEVYTKIVNARKIPYDDSGIQLIEGGLAAALDAGVAAGVIQAGYTITVPKFDDISKTEVGNRNLPDVKFTAVLLGAIHTVEIQGTLTL